MRHFIVTLHLSDCEDETFYVVGNSAWDAEEKAKRRLLEIAVADGMDADTEVYSSMVAELSAPPIRIHTEMGVIENPKPIQ